jgi:hypothetical protein
MNDIVKAAKGLGLEQVDTEIVIKQIARDILFTLRGKVPENKLEQAYKSWYPNGVWDESETAKNEKILSTLLLGPPGHGKTTTFKEAARRVAAALGMNFVMNPGDEVKITKNDFLFVSQEFSAENSKMELGGIPAKKVEDNVEYMVKLTNKRIAMLEKAGAGLLLLDDFPNASPSIQNIGLSLTDEKRFQGLNLANTYVGLTGNLGSIDGTNTGRLSTALRGRCETYFVCDKVENFIDRARSTYRDEIGDAGVSLFLERFPDQFAEMPSIKESGGFAAPRNWDHFTMQSRKAIRDVGGRGEAINAMPHINRVAKSLLGPVVGEKVYAFFYSMMRSADPLARKVIKEGNLDEQLLKKRFGDGLAGDQQHFAYQYAAALVDYTVEKIVSESSKKDPKAVLKEAISRFALGVLPVTQDAFTFAVNSLSSNLAVKMPSMSTKNQSGKYDLTTQAKQDIAKIISENPMFGLEHKTNLVDALSNFDKFETTAKRRTRRPG